EDSWTWGANATNSTVYYEAFNRNGGADADGTAGMQNLAGNLTTFMFNHNGKLTLNPSAQGVRVIDFAANGKQLINGSSLNSVRGDPAHQRTNSISINSEPITLIEQGGINTGTFGNWDGSKNSDVITVDSPTIRGQSAVVRYNDISTSIVGGFNIESLTLSLSNNTWASGQRAPLILQDSDANKNSKISEPLSVYDPKVVVIPTMAVGNPFTLSGASAGSETASLLGKVAITDTTINGLKTIAIGAGNPRNATSTNIAVHELSTFRPIFKFTNATTTASVKIN
ncbi:MAG: hypothetical protein KGI27_14815, partial [Thaumarchaeota archaeon]|nr:hypothetical protein [Nitrososphaerota archaeon]